MTAAVNERPLRVHCIVCPGKDDIDMTLACDGTVLDVDGRLGLVH